MQQEKSLMKLEDLNRRTIAELEKLDRSTTTSKKKEEVENQIHPKKRGGNNSSRNKNNESNAKTKDELEEVETWGCASLLVKDQVSNNNLETTSINSLSKNNKVKTKQMNP